jgi:hypothetical protein
MIKTGNMFARMLMQPNLMAAQRCQMFSTKEPLAYKEHKSSSFNKDGVVKDYHVSKESQWQ